MFATVECRSAPAGFRGFIKELFTLPEISLQRIKVPFGEYFYRVVVTEYRGQIPVEELLDELKRLKGSVLFETNFPYDERTFPFEFEPSELFSQLLFNSASEYLIQAPLEPLESSLVIYDAKGMYKDKLRSLVSLFSEIKVYTKETSAYEKVARELFASHGISIPVVDRLSGKAPECTAVICPGKVPFDGYFGGILFTCDEAPPPCSCCLRGEGIELPGEYELLRPQGIGRMHFAAALYEKAGVKSLGELSFKRLVRLT